MEKLPRTRPRRSAVRRKPARARAKAPAGSGAPRKSGGGASAAAAKPASARTGAGAPARSRRARKGRPARLVGVPGGEKADPTPFGPAEPAPGLPRLALDGAIEAAKLPFKVGANMTFRALDTVARSLRRG
jgi:hypothetical protein